MIYNDKWLEMFLYAKKYYEVYGNLEIPQGYTLELEMEKILLLVLA